MSKSLISVYILLVVFGTIFFVYLDYKDITVLYDDAYSIFISKLSYQEIFTVTAQDVHPPLYYWGLKLFASFFGDSLFTHRLFSSLGLIAVMFLGSFPLRKYFGHRVALTFILLIILFPVSQYLATAVRMYSWTMFFVFACALSAYKIFEVGRRKHWILFFITGICAVYMHNYGLLSVIGIYLILLICMLKNKRNWKTLLLSGVFLFFLYSPWLIQLISQINNISNDYWIKPLTINDLFLHIYYFYSPKEIGLPFTDFSKVHMMIGVIFLMAVQLIISLKVICSGYKTNKGAARIVLLLFAAFLFPVVLGFIISMIYIPIAVPRYMTCSYALFVLATAFVLVRASYLPIYKWLAVLFLVFLFADTSVRLHSNLNYYEKTANDYTEIRNFGEDKLFIVNDFSFHVIPRLQLIASDKEYKVLDSENTTEDFTPFVLDEITMAQIKMDEFVLVHQRREAIQEDFRKFCTSLSDSYYIMDSLYASDFIFYTMKKANNQQDVYNP